MCSMETAIQSTITEPNRPLGLVILGSCILIWYWLGKLWSE